MSRIDGGRVLVARQGLSPSPTLIRWAGQFSNRRPALDAGCGEGRNALTLAKIGLQVLCADRDRSRLLLLNSAAIRQNLAHSITPLCADLTPSLWPFRENSFSAIMCIHFFDPGLLPLFHASLCSGGHVFIETFGAQGGNYVDLPLAGELDALLSPKFRLSFYEERPAGPPGANRCAVKLLAKKL